MLEWYSLVQWLRLKAISGEMVRISTMRPDKCLKVCDVLKIYFTDKEKR